MPTPWRAEGFIRFIPSGNPQRSHIFGADKPLMRQSRKRSHHAPRDDEATNAVFHTRPRGSVITRSVMTTLGRRNFSVCCGEGQR